MLLVCFSLEFAGEELTFDYFASGKKGKDEDKKGKDEDKKGKDGDKKGKDEDKKSDSNKDKKIKCL